MAEARRPGPADGEIETALARCARGDAAALRLLYDGEAPRLLGVALRVLRRRALAEEAVHDAFVQIWRQAASFDPARGAGRAWMGAIVRHRALSILRHENRVEFADDGDPGRLETPQEDPEAVIGRLSDAGILRRCLERLDVRRRQLIVLAYVHGLTHGELAGRFGLPLGTVKSLIRRGALSLRECLQ